MPRSAQVLQLGNSVLREVSRKVRNPSAQDVHKTAMNLMKILEERPGWGLSAPQIGVKAKLFVMATPLITSTAQLPTLGPRVTAPGSFVKPLHFTAIVNPIVTKVSEELEAEHETCLSAPGLSALVPRHTWVEAQFQTLDSKIHKQRFVNHPARVFQHEYDHLEGILIVDRILDTCDLYMEEELTRQCDESAQSEAFAAENSAAVAEIESLYL